jgi:nucleoside-diphosphate-sugar epimerase
VEASLSLVRQFADLGGERVVTVGSCAEYAWGHEGPFREVGSPLTPATLYGVCKHALHSILDKFAREARISMAWGRVFFTYGPNEHPKRLVASTIRSLLAGEPAICMAGTLQRDFLHVHDVADALITILSSKVEGAVNIGSGKAVTIVDLVQRTAQLMGRPELVRIEAAMPTQQDPATIVADATRLRHELQWQPRYELSEGLAQTIRWYRESVYE